MSMRYQNLGVPTIYLCGKELDGIRIDSRGRMAVLRWGNVSRLVC